MQTWSTDAVPKFERFSFWNDAVCDAFLRVRTERVEKSSFNGTITSSTFGPLYVNHVNSERHLVRRSRGAISADTNGWFFVNLQRAGDCVLSQNDRHQHVAAGELCFFDGIRPFDLDFRSDMSLTSFLIPRDALIARAVRAPERVVQPIRSTGIGAMLHRFSTELAANVPLLSAAAAVQLGEMYLDLLALALNDEAKTLEAARGTARNALLAAIRADIRLRLSNPALDIAAVAASAAIAPRTLQTWFHETGTSFTEYLLEQRLLLAERQLSNSAQDRSVSEVAYAVGFSDLSYFSRRFRRRFGIRPSDLRAGARRQEMR